MAEAELSQSVTVAADGTASFVFGPSSRFERWTVRQVSVEMATAPLGSTCDLRRQGILVTPLIPTGDAATGDPPVPLRRGQTLTVSWAGCTTGEIGTVFVLYDDGSTL